MAGAVVRITSVLDDRASIGLKRLRRNLDDVDKGQSATGRGAFGMAKALIGANSASSALAIGAGIAATAIVAVGAAVVAGASRAIKASSDYNEALNKSQVLFGSSADIVKQFAETAADALGMTSTQALAATGAYGAMFKALGIGSAQAADMSVAMAKLAADMSSFNNVDPSEMLDKLRAGLAGESEPLRQVGVFLNEASVAQEAMRATGKRNATQLTEQEKVLARYRIILKQTAQQQGDFARTADDPANAMRRISAGVEEIFRTVGESLMPEVKPTLQSLMLLLKDVGLGIKAAFADPATQEFIHSLGEGIRAIIDIFRSLLPVLGLVFRAFVTLFGPILTKGVQILKTVADVLRYVSQLFKGGIDWFKAWIAGFGQWPKAGAGFAAVVVDIIDKIAKLLNLPSPKIIIDWVVNALNLPDLGSRVVQITWKVAELTIPALQGITVTVTFIREHWEDIQKALDAIVPVISVVFTAVTETAIDAINGLITTITGVPTDIRPMFTAIVDAAIQAVLDLKAKIESVPSWRFDFSTDTTQIMQLINDLLTNLARIPTMISTAFNFVPESITEAWNTVNSWISHLADIPRMITTVLHTVQGDNQVSDAHGAAASQGAPSTATRSGGAVAGGGYGADIGGALAAGAAAAAIAGAAAGIAAATGGCFEAGTPVWMGDGTLRPIEDIHQGDIVMSWDEVEGLMPSRVVVPFTHRDHASLWTLHIHTSTGIVRLDTTAEHPYRRDDEWVRADALRIGDAVLIAQSGVTRAGIVIISRAKQARLDVYNFEVANTHTYIVGPSHAGVVVHNAKLGTGLSLGYAMAAGGIVTGPTRALVGEAGPEAVIPLAQLPSIMGAMGGIGTVVINVSGYADGAGAGTAAADAFRRALGLQRRMPFATV